MESGRPWRRITALIITSARPSDIKVYYSFVAHHPCQAVNDGQDRVIHDQSLLGENPVTKSIVKHFHFIRRNRQRLQIPIWLVPCRFLPSGICLIHSHTSPLPPWRSPIRLSRVLLAPGSSQCKMTGKHRIVMMMASRDSGAQGLKVCNIYCLKKGSHRPPSKGSPKISEKALMSASAKRFWNRRIRLATS